MSYGMGDNKKLFVIVFLGFTQKVGGMSAVWSRLHDALSGPGNVVNVLPWNFPADHIAEIINRSGSGTESTRIRLAGYSYGGQTAVNVAHRLGHMGYTTERLALVDPVYRSHMKTCIWKSLIPPAKPSRRSTGKYDGVRLRFSQVAYCAGATAPCLRPRIVVPRRVERVLWYRQRLSVPMGHDLKTFIQTEVDGPHELNVLHEYIDDNEDVTNKVVEFLAA